MPEQSSGPDDPRRSLPTPTGISRPGGEVLRQPANLVDTVPTDPQADRLSIPTPTMGGRQGLPGTPCIAGYEILGVLGRGGMGVVYKARHLKLNRVVALKMILAGSYAGPEELLRFHTEAEAVARLQHPNIVQIFDVGEHAEAGGPSYPFMALEYVPGGTLAQKVIESPPSAREAAALVELLARAMHSAHERGIIHRDLKPANVLLAEDGTPKITDFGLAKHLEAPGGQTQTGQVMGTPEYMAPEQAAGQIHALGPATDGYALGAILYALVTGRPPFRGVTVLATLEQVQKREPVPPSQLQPGLPRDLETICLKCLHKEPSRRYARAADLADDLRRFLDGVPIKARPVGRIEAAARWCRRYPLVASLLVLLALSLAGAIGGLLAAVVEANEKEVERQAADGARLLAEQNGEKEKAQRLKTEEQKKIAEKATEVAEAKTAEAVAATKQEKAAKEELKRILAYTQVLLAGQYEFNNNTVLAEQMLAKVPPELRHFEWNYLKRLCAGNVRVLSGHQAEVPALAFSADGRRLASAGLDQSARVWDVNSGDALYASPAFPESARSMGDIPHFGRNATVALSPDGTRLLVPIPFTGPQFTPEWKVGRVRDLVAGKDICTLQSPNLTYIKRFVFSPDGKQVAGVGESFQGRLRLWDAATGREIKNLSGNTSMVYELAFSPDGKLIATIGDNANKGELKLWDLDTGKETFTFTADIFDQFAAVAFSPDGKYLVACGKNITPQVEGSAIRHKGIFKVWDVAKRELLEKFPIPSDPASSPVFSPDSRLLAATFTGNKARVFDLKRQEEILAMPGWGDVPYHQVLAFSPDSKRLALAGFYNVQVWDVAGKKQVLDLRGHAKQVLSVAFSPDGRRLASGGADHAVRFWDLQAAERPLALRDGNRVFDQAVISSDGELIATAGVEHVIGKKLTGQIQLWKSATGERVRSWEGHDDPIKELAFSPDGKCLASASWQAVKLWSTATGKELRSFKGHNAQAFGALSGANAVAFRPDGKLVATTGNDGTLQLWNPDTGEVTFRWQAETKETRFGRGLAFSRDGTRLAVGFQVGFRGEIKVFDTASRQVVCAVPHMIEPGGGKLALSPDGTRLAALHPLAAEANPQSLAEVHLWDATNGKHLFDLRGHSTRIGGVSFSPDGKRLASASWDGTVKLWDLETPKEVLTLRGPRGYAFGVSFSDDGNRLISTHSLLSSAGFPGAGEVRIWDARPLPPPKVPRPQR